MKVEQDDNTTIADLVREASATTSSSSSTTELLINNNNTTVSSSEHANSSSSSKSYSFSEKFGDLFSDENTDSLCHCVSEDLAMSKGIALIFKNKYGRVDELRKQNAKTGGLAVLHVPEDNRYIYYLVTKPKYFLKPTYDTLLSSLKCMKQHAIEHNVTRISMPLIGCGLDRLLWPRVRNLLDETFGDLEMHLTVYKLDNNDSSNNSGKSRNKGNGGGGNKKGGRGGGQKRGNNSQSSGYHQRGGKKTK
ncbi:hypothetical protein C9374_007067 [Naegleria lovaniensis]|uniref:Macro domain-containing protein n=1 Tax=Naegleria lovaniensis TaxID=51637 RepID=A0AA88H6H2_NAELO|nr:uncharacterized protein C9374_007067 [Naegleria lovaniensis]KAG2393536.1 hypothetical protein C9374_007067 [Naegleria lovaniensis]